MAYRENSNGYGSHAAFRTLAEQQRFVDFLNKKQDHECAMLLAFGYSTGYIMSKTGLSAGQVIYRAQKANIKRADYRSGQSSFAQAVLRTARGVIDAKLMTHLRKEGLLYSHAA